MKVTAFTPAYGLKPSHRKENHLRCSLIAIDKKGEPIADLSVYAPTYTTSYACLWIYGARFGHHGSGSGKASGSGYHKASAAAEAAITSAGFKLDMAVSGDGRMLEAMEAIGRHIAKRQFLAVVNATG